MSAVDAITQTTEGRPAVEAYSTSKLSDFQEGQHVEINPARARAMRVESSGVVESVGERFVRVRVPASRRTVAMSAGNLRPRATRSR